MTLRHHLYRARFHLAPHVPRRFPVHLDLELAGRCQLRCVMCPYGDHADGTGSFDASKQGMMRPAVASEALKQAHAGGTLSLKMNFRGEPGLSPLLLGVVAEAKKLGFIEVAINTNLTSFSERRLASLAAVGLDLIIISIDGATKETYESIRINGDFEKLVSNLRFIHGLTPRPRIRLQMVVQDSNRHEVELMRQLFNGLCDELILQPIRQDNAGERKRCSQPFQRMIVGWNGEVYGCCNNWTTTYILGHFPHQSLSEIWHGEQAKTLREYAKHPERGEPCASCLVGCSYKKRPAAKRVT